MLKPLELFTRTALLSVLLLCLPLAARAQEAELSPFALMREEAVSYFVPLEGTVTAVKNGNVISDMGAEKRVRPGMRFTVTRKGTPFLHPITKEPLGKLESVVGLTQVVRVEDETAELKVLRGTPAVTDVLRLSSAPVRVLFFQSSEVDWNISEAYYQLLKEEKRFVIIDTEPGALSDEQLIDEGRKAGADVVLVLTSEESEKDVILSQRFLWTVDGTEVFAQDMPIEADLVAELRIGSDLFTPKKATTVSIDLDMRAIFIRSGDFNGDGESEIAIGTWSDLTFYKPAVPLVPALSGLEFKALKGELNIWMDVADLDGDGADEILITSKRDNRITSRVYKYESGTLSQIYKTPRFMRIINGKLYAQKYLIGTGYGGKVFPVSREGVETGEDLNLPKGVNIYDFQFLKNAEGKRILAAYDSRGRLNLYNEENALLWQSPRDFGGAIVEFAMSKSDSGDDTKNWVVNDRIHAMGRSAYVVNRIPVYRGSKGIGYRKSQILGLRWLGPTLKGTAVVDNVPGSILDFEVVDKKVFVLAKPWLGVDTKNLIKGKNPLVSKLYVYSLKGF